MKLHEIKNEVKVLYDSLERSIILINESSCETTKQVLEKEILDKVKDFSNKHCSFKPLGDIEMLDIEIPDMEDLNMAFDDVCMNDFNNNYYPDDLNIYE